MSGIAGLYNVPSTQAELNTWSFIHSVHHEDISNTILRVLGVTIPNYVLDPISPEAIYPFLQQHQALHDQISAVLGIEGYDLTDVDWQDPNQLNGWIFLNATVHVQASNILKIG